MLKLSNRTFVNMGLTVVILLSLFANALSMDNMGLYKYIDTSHPLQELNRGDKEFTSLMLEKPINFFSENYDKIYINTNGILTFNIEYPEYINQPFPLEYPSIAPFYANVDTSGNDEFTSITLFESQDFEQLRRASNMVRYAFVEKPDFEANRIIIGTWKNVGYFEAKSNLLNTFQAVIIANDNETFVQYIYPEDGINWLQSEMGQYGLPDIRPQIGFIAEDGRIFNLVGSATENARYLAKTSNVGLPGNWIYQVGLLEPSDNVRPPTNPEIPQDTPKHLWTCTEAVHGYCNSHAKCFDKSNGFCCVCEDNYFGNGHDCIKKDEPLRVIGTFSGEINQEDLTDILNMQSYVDMVEAQSYTSIFPAETEMGSNLRLVVPIFSTIGWLFAAPLNGALNGYDLTGGVFTHESKLHFETGEILFVNQSFEGLNYWDQLSAKIDIVGHVPHVPYDSSLQMPDYINEYKFESPNTLRSVHAHSIEVVNEKRAINFQLDQTIRFERCLLPGDDDLFGTTVLEKVSKITMDYTERDKALRSSLFNKIGVMADSTPCTEEVTSCGANTVCVPTDDTYRCECVYGYRSGMDSNGAEVCIDINECATGSSICGENALCSNNDGGFTCICIEGYIGNGFQCVVNSTTDNIETPEQIIDVANVDFGTESYPYETPDNNPDSKCNQCSRNGYCLEGQCYCNAGFKGNGYYCQDQCPSGESWYQDKCQPVQLDNLETDPTCDYTGTCTCPEDYALNIESKVCYYVGNEHDKVSDQCDNCDANAHCAWNSREYTYKCTCNTGYHGDGLQCEIIDETCLLKPEICDANAYCAYDEGLGKSTCFCRNGYKGDGFHCELAPECRQDYDCGKLAWCDQGICQCNAGYDGNPLDECRIIPCNIQNHCDLHASCQATDRDGSEYECVCDAGYDGNGYVCIEFENCLKNPHLCDMNAKCSSTNNGLVCQCNPGFYGNGSVCFEDRRHESGFLLISQGVVIVRKSIGSKISNPIAIASMAIGLDKDCVAGRVYWGDISKKTIESAFYNGTDRTIFINEDVESPEGFAIDVSSRRIYWTDSVKDTIEVASLDNPKLRAVIIQKNLVNPRGIAVDPLREKLYWADWNRDSPKIEMSNLDGSDRQLLVGSDELKLPNSLVVLENTGELCFADAGTKKIQCIEPYSKNLRTISQNLAYPFGLTFSQNQFYWTDWTTKKLESVDSYGGNRESQQITLFGSHKMFGMTAIEDYCPRLMTTCSFNNGGCGDSSICLVNQKAQFGRSCKTSPVCNFRPGNNALDDEC